MTEPSDRRYGRRRVFVGLAIFALAVAVRLIRYGQSLWGDEMETVRGYVTAPWRVVVAAGAGQYVPNLHLGFTALAKACLDVGAGGRVDRAGVTAALVRLPSLVAGSLVPVAAAWPLRRSSPGAAAVLAILLAVHPWLVAQSDEARGYAMMVLVGIVATNLLPTAGRRWPVAYGVAVAGMLYTVPVAGLLVAAHGVVAVARRSVGAWVRGAAIGVGLAGLLYLPLAGGIADYARHSLVTPNDVGGFLADVPQFAAAGRAVTGGGWVGGGVVVVWVLGTIAGRRRPVRALTAVMGTATVVAVAAAAVWPAAGQVRFVPWAAVWACGAMTSLLMWIGDRIGRRAAGVGVAAVVAAGVWADVSMPPEQPAREGIVAADQMAPAGSAVVVAFLTATDAVRFYGDRSAAHPVRAAESPADFRRAEAEAFRATGRRPWVVVSFGPLVRDYSPETWAYLDANYRAVDRLPGRVSDVTVYAPR